MRCCIHCIVKDKRMLYTYIHRNIVSIFPRVLRAINVANVQNSIFLKTSRHTVEKFHSIFAAYFSTLFLPAVCHEKPEYPVCNSCVHTFVCTRTRVRNDECNVARVQRQQNIKHGEFTRRAGESEGSYVLPRVWYNANWNRFAIAARCHSSFSSERLASISRDINPSNRRRSLSTNLFVTPDEITRL